MTQPTIDPEALGCACQETLPPLAQQGVAMFNAGEYYQQHDLFEEQWVNTSGPERTLYQGILRQLILLLTSTQKQNCQRIS